MKKTRRKMNAPTTTAASVLILAAFAVSLASGQQRRVDHHLAFLDRLHLEARSTIEAASRYLGLPSVRSVPALVRDFGERSLRIPRQLSSLIVDGGSSLRRLMRLPTNQKTSKEAGKLAAVDPKLMPVPKMIRGEGFDVEVHQVTTADGYILTMHRITGRTGGAGVGIGKPAVLVNHGLLCSSADWVMGSPDKSLGYILSDAGFDVWLGNFRGNRYSRNHVNATGLMNPDDRPFWSFSIHELGKYDLPAMMEHVLRDTGLPSLTYVGHSMGTTALWIMTDLYPRYANDKVDLAVALAPVARLSNMISPLRFLIPMSTHIEQALLSIGQHEFWAPESIQAKLSRIICQNIDDIQDSFSNEVLLNSNAMMGKMMRQSSINPCHITKNIIFLMTGFDQDQMNMTLLPRILYHTPAGTSPMTMLHFAQIYSGGFRGFDGGVEYNLRVYGTAYPRHYSLKNARYPVAIYWGPNDWLATPKDVTWLAERLPNVVLAKPVGTFNHPDFMWGRDAGALLYGDIVKLITKHSRN